MTTYEDSGVHNDAKEDVSQILYNAAKRTWDNRKGKLGEVISAFDDFSGVRAIDVSNLPKGTLMNIGFDGVGTKMELAERLNDHRTIAYDLFAMVCDDAIVRGAEPVLVGSILDTNSLKGKNGPFVEQVRQLAEGYVNAAKAANVAVVNGECAELGSRVGGYGEFNYNWGAAVVWFANKDRMLTGKEIQLGDTLVGLREEGIRSNGLSLVRKIMKDNFGDDWHSKKFGEKSYGELVLTPSTIYSAAVVNMFGGFNGEPRTEVHGVAHITGGGIPGKLGRMLKPSGLSAHLTYRFPLTPSMIMRQVQELGNVTDETAYKTWNMGTGAIIATPKPDEVIKIAQEYGIDAGEIGEVTHTQRYNKKPEIRIGNLNFEI
ncbi:MAG: AIR synthase-related protein [archaeon]|nr:AIR synthase-related protein [archaeon]